MAQIKKIAVFIGVFALFISLVSVFKLPSQTLQAQSDAVVLRMGVRWALTAPKSLVALDNGERRLPRLR